MEYEIPKEWCEKWAKKEAESDGSCTLPVNPQIMAEIAARAARRRYDDIHGGVMEYERFWRLMGDKSMKLSADEIASGWHFCYDWDGLLVGPGRVEWDCCTCKVPGKPGYVKENVA